MFFSEEKNQKTFMSGASGSGRAIASQRGSDEEIKVFCFFSSEKKALLSSLGKTNQGV
jgi:hypothetical protein